MKKLFLSLIAVVAVSLSANAQSFDSDGFASLDSKWELSGSYVSAAVSDGINTITGGGGQISIAYDFFDGGFKLAPEVDLNFAAGEFGVIPGLQVGHDNIYALASYNSSLSIPYLGVGGRIDLGDSSAISLQIQGGQFEGLGIGYGSVGYTFKF